MKGYSQMKRQGFVALGAFVASAIFSVCPVCAQDEDAADENAVEATDLPAPAQEPKQRGLLTYYAYVRCEAVNGNVKVLRPGPNEEPMDVKLGKFYPLGSTIITGNSGGKRGVEPSSAIFNFGKAVMVKVTEGAEFGTRVATDDKCRTITLRKGRVELLLPRQMKDGEFEVAAPHFVLNNMNGNSWIEYSASNNCDRTVVHLTTGLMGVQGAHYTIPQMRAGDELEITTSDDDAFSCITSRSGLYNVVLDQGIRREKDFETEQIKETPVSYKFEMAPKCKVKVWRRQPVVGGNMVVSTMAIDATGEIKSRRVFSEKRYNINSGELVITQKEREEAAAALQHLGDAGDIETVAVTPAEEPEAPAVEEPAAADSGSSDSESMDDLF